MPNLLFYAKGGGAWTHVTFDTVTKTAAGVPTLFAQGDKDLSGWTIGAGAEYKVTRNLVMRAEYNYVDFGSASTSRNVLFGTAAPVLTGTSLARDYASHLNIVKIGAAWLFN